MTIPGSANPLLLTSAPVVAAGARSLRFNSADSAYLSRTFGSPTDQDVFTLSLWVKRSALGSTQQLFGVSTNHSFGFTSGDALNLTFGGSSALTTTALFRDPSAWYHIVWKQNVNAHELYVNGVSVGTATATSNTFNTAAAHQIGAANTTDYFNGYITDAFFVDGQALDPTSFGEFDATTGVWVPKAFSGGSYGTNGFHLPFDDNSTAAALGHDAAGSNDWTVNNISVTAGAGNDSLVDVPTNGAQTDTGVGGEVRGNYCTWNPLDKNSSLSLSNGNLDASAGASQGVNATFNIPTGSWYWEVTVNTVAGANGTLLGMIGAGQTASVRDVAIEGLRIMARNDGAILKDATTNQTGLASWSNGDVIGCAYNATTNSIQFYRNGSTYGSAITPTTGTYVPWCGATSNTASFSANFGQRPFAYTAPSGFKALCTANLPAPVVTKPSEYMDVKLYLGNGSSQTISGLEFSPDFVWIKNRSNGSVAHRLYDTVRTATKELYSNLTNAEDTDAQGLNAFTSSGFTVGTTAGVNENSSAIVAWAWDAGSSTVTNTQGSITSSVRANASAGFSIVTYTGNGSAGATVGHGLGVAPRMIIIKNRDAADAWQVYHAANTANPETDYLVLNTTAATADALDRWNDTAPTSTLFTLGDGVEVNTNTEDYVAYCFAGVSGYSSAFSFTGNGSSDGPMVHLGFRPRMILLKRSDSSGENWRIVDTARETYNVMGINELYPNSSAAEGGVGTVNFVDVLSNGFKLRNSASGVNASGGTYIGFAWAESPFNYARAR